MSDSRKTLRRWFALCAVMLVVAISGCEPEDAAPTPSPAAQFPPTTLPSQTSVATTTTTLPDTTQARVVRVVDGDTIVARVDGREERVRYIGIDTPESVDPNRPVECYGPEASQANARLVEGKTVHLERDVSDRDQYGRLLRYVYVNDPAGSGPLFVNRTLVAQGYAEASRYPPDTRYSEQLARAEEEAMRADAGLWGACE